MTEEIDGLLMMTKRIWELVEKSRSDENIWDEVSALMRERQSRLERFFANGIPPEQVDAVKSSIEAILQDDAKTFHVLEAKKRLVAEELAGIAKGRNARQAYLNQLFS